MSAIDSLIEGYRAFRTGTYRQNEERYRALASRMQKPKALIIACCDSRADPAMVFSADPGELFVVRNVANLVPPYEPDTHYHGTSAAIEFGVTGLGIADVIVMGHARCGGIEALYESDHGNPPKGEFVSGWMSLAQGVAEDVRKTHAHLDRDAMLRQMEQRAVLSSLEMLRTFPFIREREADGRVRLHGWFYGIGSGVLSVYDRTHDRFIDVPDKD
ncbi:carbonic anhydrase [Parvibaculum sedimenti]|uniref:Carbonic anhydrase n=1 Tax=Parvibaculum sedimenti TaxID=2608632 RepID=A0A6N6VLZ0_9HYPH|nr:carbonic anhydrase [Parvibaculum sedimenti]KAB7739663.1 carbonic anhydrase [Parvibaculum sedimenti]